MGLIFKGIVVTLHCPRCKSRMIYDRCDKCGTQKLRGVKRELQRVAVECQKCGDHWTRSRCPGCGFMCTIEECGRF